MSFSIRTGTNSFHWHRRLDLGYQLFDMLLPSARLLLEEHDARPYSHIQRYWRPWTRYSGIILYPGRHNLMHNPSSVERKVRDDDGFILFSLENHNLSNYLCILQTYIDLRVFPFFLPSITLPSSLLAKTITAQLQRIETKMKLLSLTTTSTFFFVILTAFSSLAAAQTGVFDDCSGKPGKIRRNPTKRRTNFFFFANQPTRVSRTLYTTTRAML